MVPDLPKPMEFGSAGPLRGSVTPPGDKSISHRALMLAAMASGRSLIVGPSEGEDVAATAGALCAMGARIGRAAGEWQVDGVGTGALLQPRHALDMGNSGTSTRLLMGLAATHRISAAFVGDLSLTRRPMSRVISPLARLGARITAAPGGRLPLIVEGLVPAPGQRFEVEVASAQVKSALLLAGLNACGATEVVERVPTRDHTERMLRQFGAELQVRPQGPGRAIRLVGEGALRPRQIEVPGDFSSAAFLVAAALIVPGSDVRLRNVGINPLRTGLIDMLRRMGAEIVLENPHDLGGEPVADIIVRHSPLRAAHVPPELVPAMIDEFPIFFVAAAFADGESRASGLSELRVKESDRIAAMAAGLKSLGVPVKEEDDGLAIEGSGGRPLLGGASIAPELDHRVAMSFAVAGLHSVRPVCIRDMRPAATSYPGFASDLEMLLSS